MDDTHDEKIEAAWIVLGDVLRQAIVQRPELGDAVLLLAQALRPEPSEERDLEPSEVAAEEVVETVSNAVTTPAELDQVPPEPEPQSLGFSEPGLPTRDWRDVQVSLELVAQRAGLKAQALDWAVRRREILKGKYEFNLDVKPTDVRLLDAARELRDCFLWMLMPNGIQERLNQLTLNELASCYRAMEMVAEVAGSWELDQDQVSDEHALTGLLMLAAEAQSALRSGLEDANVGSDEDQRDLFAWVRQQTDKHRVFLDRYMSRESVAKPQALDDFPERLGGLRERAEQKLAREKNRQKSINRIEYHVKILEEHLASGAEPEEEALGHDWRKIVGTASAWVQDGNQVTDERLLACMARIAEEVPAEFVTGHMTSILEAVGRWLDSRAEAPDAEFVDGAPEPSVGGGPADVPEAIERALERHAERLVLALNKRSDKEYPYTRPREVLLALEWLAERLWPLKSGQTSGVDHRKLNHELLERCGWFYRPRQAATTLGTFRDWYRCSFEGRTLVLEEHVGRGNAKRQGPNVIRIAFAWDAPSQKIVIGFLGQHQRTSGT